LTNIGSTVLAEQKRAEVI